jgi:hypothetical protein
MNAIRLVGAALGAAISLAIELLPFSVAEATAFWLRFDGIGLYGAPIAGLLGWWLGPHVVAGSRRWGLAVGIGMGLAAAPLGALGIAYATLLLVLAGGDLGGPGAGGLAGALMVATLGLPLSLFVLPITVPAGIVWASILRAVRELRGWQGPIEPSPFGFSHAAALLTIGGLLAALFGMVRP